jgi:hypothetical protein
MPRLLLPVALWLMLAALPSHAAIGTPPTAAEPPDLQERATAEAARILDVDGYLALRAAELRDAEQGRFGRIPRPDLDRLRVAHATMARLLDGRGSALELDINQRVELFNSQQTISSILDHQADTALVCERSKRTGTNIRETRCFTRAERELRRQAEQDGLRVPHIDPPCGPGYAGELRPDCPGR